jgi:phosphocarrier protein
MPSKNTIILEPTDEKRRRQTIDRFRGLLGSKTRERDWQTFFDENPFVFSDTLSVKLDALYRQVPLISGRPDYIFCQKTKTPFMGDYGVIELKRPTDSIIGTYSSKFIVESKALRVAVKEASRHLEAMTLGNFLNPEDFLVAGNRRYAFIIIGSSAEIAKKCREDFLRQQFRTLLPPGFHLYTYDELLRLFSATVPPIVQLLFVSPAESLDTEVTRKFRITTKIGLADQPVVALVRTAMRFRSEITVSNDNGQANATNYFECLMLFAAYQSEVIVTAKGRDATTAMRALDELFRRRLFAETDFSKVDQSAEDMIVELGIATRSQLTAEFDAKKRNEEQLIREANRRHEMIRVAAYYCAEKDGFTKSPREYWQQGQAQMEDRFRKQDMK